MKNNTCDTMYTIQMIKSMIGYTNIMKKITNKKTKETTLCQK
jgi:hypothetical protein